MECLLEMNFCDKLWTLRLLSITKQFFFLLFRYGILQNSCLLSNLPYFSWLQVLSMFKTFRFSRLYAVVQSCRHHLPPINTLTIVSNFCFFLINMLKIIDWALSFPIIMPVLKNRELLRETLNSSLLPYFI